MTERRKTIAIIPARGGSKGLPGKNILMFEGKPLLAHSILAAKASNLIDKVIVSTDDEEIKRIAIHFGAEVPFIRPSHLSSDEAETTEVLVHAIDFLKSKNELYDTLILLQPTSPLRNSEHIKQALEIYNKNAPCTVVSVYKVERKYNWLLNKDKNGNIKFIQGNVLKPRQALPEIYLPNGAIYICKADEVQKGFYTNNAFPFVMDIELSIDIDTRLDFDKAVETYKKKLQ